MMEDQDWVLGGYRARITLRKLDAGWFLEISGVNHRPGFAEKPWRGAFEDVRDAKVQAIALVMEFFEGAQAEEGRREEYLKTRPKDADLARGVFD